MTSLFCSASTTASWTHFIAVSKSTISPLRTPRDGAWPTPRIFRVPSGRVSPTTTQIFDVPISKPITRSPVAMFLIFPKGLQKSALRRCGDWRRSWSRTWFSIRRRYWLRLFRFRRRSTRRRCWRCASHRNRLHYARRLVRLNCLINDFRRRLLERHGYISLHEEIHGCDLAVRVVGINQELLQPLKLKIKIIKAECDFAVILVGHDQAITF